MTEATPTTAVPASSPRRTVRRATTALLVLATVLAGTLSPMQSAVNGALGKAVGDGNSAAVISFGSGLLLMFIVVFARASTRRQALRVPRLIRQGAIGWWNYLAGLCGAAVVLAEGVSVGALGVAVFQIALISGMVISGVLCDRLGVTVSVRQPISVARASGAVLAIVATAVAISPSFRVPGAIALAVLPFLAGLLAGWQPAGNAAVARGTGSVLVSITINFFVGFVVLGIGLLIRIGAGSASFTLPGSWWMYLGGVLGLASIALMALLVRGLGLLLLGLASVAGQLVGSLLLDLIVPSVGQPVHLVTVLGTVLALIAAGIGMIPSRKRIDDEPVEKAGQS